MNERPELRALADRLGIEAGYDSALERRHVEVPESTLEALVAALGYDGSSEAEAARGLRALDEVKAGRIVDPLRVVVAGSEGARTVPIRSSGSASAAGLVCEDGSEFELVRDDSSGGSALRLPDDLPLGEHRLEIHGAGSAGPEIGQLVVVPERAYTVDEALGGARGFGVQANVYTLRGRSGVGHGHFGDLGDLVDAVGRHGGDFVGMNPIHAAAHATGETSPYSPIDRLARDPLYLDLTAIPELAGSPAAQSLLASPEAAALREGDRIDRARAWPFVRDVLRQIFTHFRVVSASGGERGRAFAEARTSGAGALEDHATFVAIAEWAEARGQRDGSAWDFRIWPKEFRDRAGDGVRGFRRVHLHEIDFHVWIQWLLDEQLREAAARAKRAGLRLGLCADLAIGAQPGGVESWRDPSAFVLDATVGAPPDDFARGGQDWGFPPMDPNRLVDGDGHSHFLALLRASLRHAGLLRIDHVMSLARLFWVPKGQPASAGAYVRYPLDVTLGLLCLESRRQRAVLIGEDLGTVPEGFSDTIRRRGLLSTRLLHFEREWYGFRPSHEYPAQAMVAVNSHDFVPLAGWLEEEDLRLGRTTGRFADDAAFETGRADRARERGELEGRLREEGVLGGDVALDARTAAGATARFLGRTPSALVGLSLDDLSGERVPINLPGVQRHVHESWTRRMARTVDDVVEGAQAGEAFAAMAETGRARPQRPRGQDGSGPPPSIGGGGPPLAVGESGESGSQA